MVTSIGPQDYQIQVLATHTVRKQNATKIIIFNKIRILSSQQALHRMLTERGTVAR